MIYGNKKDREGYTRERDLNTMKSNSYLKPGEIVKLRNGMSYYEITDEETDIPLNNGFFAKKIYIEDDELITNDKKIIGAINEIKRGNIPTDSHNHTVKTIITDAEHQFINSIDRKLLDEFKSSKVDNISCILNKNIENKFIIPTSINIQYSFFYIFCNGIKLIENIDYVINLEDRSILLINDFSEEIEIEFNSISRSVFNYYDKGIVNQENNIIINDFLITNANKINLFVAGKKLILNSDFTVNEELNNIILINNNYTNLKYEVYIFSKDIIYSDEVAIATKKLLYSRNINGVEFDGTKDIEITADANKLKTPISITFEGDVIENTINDIDFSENLNISLKIDNEKFYNKEEIDELIKNIDFPELSTESINSLKGYILQDFENLDLEETDNLNTALSKLERKLNQKGGGIHSGSDEPDHTDAIWVNPLDEDYDYIPPGENSLYEEIKNKIIDFKKIIDKIDYKLNYKIDGGERLEPQDELNKKFKTNAYSSENSEETEEGLEGEYPELEEDYVPETPEELDGTVRHICIARGKREYMGNLLPGEFFLDTSKNELYLGGETKTIIVGSGSGGGGSSNVTAEYIELLDSKGIAYKIKVNESGKLEMYKSSVDKAPLPNPNEPVEGGVYHENWDEYKSTDGTGICINQIYSGGALNSDNTPVSHSFIELYNNSERDISLRGLSVQFSRVGKDWKVCPLDGVLPGNTSYLIRCAKHTNPYKMACRVKINEFDLDWNQELSYTGMKVALVVGTDPLDTENPYRDPKNGIPSIYRYLDMLGAGGKDISQKIDYQEGYFSRQCLDRNTGICRIFREGLKDKDNNLLDTMPIDYRYADIEAYGPRCRSDGPWDIYRDKIKLANNRPNMIFITFGKNQHTRIFTWQSKPTKEGFLKIRKVGEDSWKSYKTTLRNISHHDTSAVTHTVKVSNLTPGIYEYKAGEEGKWSDEYRFEVFDELYGDFTTEETPDSSFSDRTIKILQTSDQQGWSEEEYLAWKNAHEYIYNNEKIKPLETTGKSNYDWRFNTGDASQNGNRSYEWRYYYDAAKEDLPNTVEMLVIGNNDLVDKKKSEAYTYYSNYEDSPYPGCYEFFIGDVHFLSYNTWAGVDTDYKDIDGVTDGYTQKQIEWLKEKLSGPRKRWTVVLTHVAPYTIVKQKQGQPYRDVLEGNNGEFPPVDLVICGHNHAYSRSEPMFNDVVDKLNGVYHVMSQSTGYKLSGREKPNPEGEYWYARKEDGSYSVGVPGNPSYIMWEITKDYIEFKSYMIQGIILKDSTTKEVTFGDPSTYRKELIDTFKIYHRSVRAEHLDEL